MEYRDFKDKHAGQKIIVCGCGESASLIEKVSDKQPTVIGVNDFCRVYTPSYLVVLNDKVGFNEDRWKWIQLSTAPFLFTHIRTLSTISPKVLLELGKYGRSDFESGKVDYTSNSPYVACLIAAFMGATEIGLLGVDFTDSKHPLTRRLPQIKLEYKELSESLRKRGRRLVNLSPVSQLGLEHVDIEQFLP